MGISQEPFCMDDFGVCVGLCWGYVGTSCRLYFGLGHCILGSCKAWAKKRSEHKEKNGCVANAFHAMFNYVCEVFFGVAVAFGL